jgi:hypothetical protein
VIVGSLALGRHRRRSVGAGLTQSSDALFYSSIVASVLAALALLVGVRQFPAGRLPEADFDVRPVVPVPAALPSGRPVARRSRGGRSRPGPIQRYGGRHAVEDAADLARA